MQEKEKVGILKSPFFPSRLPMKKPPSQIVEEMKQARAADNREGFMIAVYELMEHHRSWLEYRYGTFDGQVEDGLNQALLQAMDHANFDSILHPETYFKQVAENFIKSERRKSRRAESLDKDEENPFEAQDTLSALNPQQLLEIARHHQLLVDLNIPSIMDDTRRVIEKKYPLQAYLLTARAENDKISYTELARLLKMQDDPKSLTKLRVQYLRGKTNYLEVFQKELKKKAAEKYDECQEAFQHYLSNMKHYPPIPGISALVSAGGSGEG